MAHTLALALHYNWCAGGEVLNSADSRRLLAVSRRYLATPIEFLRPTGPRSGHSTATGSPAQSQAPDYADQRASPWLANHSFRSARGHHSANSRTTSPASAMQERYAPTEFAPRHRCGFSVPYNRIRQGLPSRYHHRRCPKSLYIRNM